MEITEKKQIKKALKKAFDERKKAAEERASASAGASVLIPLLQKDDIWHVLFEKRALHLLHQPGEICFPGGKHEGNESDEETARRETAEELCIDKETIEIISPPMYMAGPGNRRMGVFVGILQDYQGTFEADEVDSVYCIPLHWFLETEPKGYEVDMVSVPREDFPFDRIPGGRDYPWKVATKTVYFYDHPDINIWGFTAGVMRDFIGILQEYS